MWPREPIRGMWMRDLSGRSVIPEKWADWGYRAVHEMVVVTKNTR